MNDAESRHDFEAHWHDDGGVTLTHQGQSHSFDGRDSALRFVRDVARSARLGRSLRVRTVEGEGPGALVVSPEGNYYDEHHPGIRGSISDLGAVGQRSRSSRATNSQPAPKAPAVSPVAATPVAVAPAAAVVAAENEAPGHSVSAAPIVATLREAAAAADTLGTGVRRAGNPRDSNGPASYVGRRRRESFVDDKAPELAPTH